MGISPMLAIGGDGVMVTQLTNQLDEGGSIPTSPLQNIKYEGKI